jgi:hypothetical protein
MTMLPPPREKRGQAALEAFALAALLAVHLSRGRS